MFSPLGFSGSLGLKWELENSPRVFQEPEMTMGRGSVRKVDPSIDLSEHLWHMDRLPRPWDPGVVFPQPGPVEVDVGCGKGTFLLQASLEHPQRNYLGIEKQYKFAAYSASRVAKRHLPNARVVHGDALWVFREVFTPGSLAAVHVYFPDPWWKKRHRKRRVMVQPFLEDVQRTLQPGGELHFWTDVEDYFQETVALIAQVTDLEGPFEVPQRPAQHDLDYRTNYERKARLQGRPVFRALYRKRSS